MTRKECLFSLGPVTSNWGLTAWRLLLGHNEIVAWPYSWSEGFRLGMWQEYGLSRDPGAFLPTTDSLGFMDFMKGRRLQTYPVAEIQSITFARTYLRNQIEILTRDGLCVRYGLMDRHKFDEDRDRMRSLYGNLVIESGIPKSTWEKILKM